MNSDAQFEYLMRKAKIDMKTQVGSPEAQALRPEAKRLTRSRETGYITGRLGLLIDGTGDEYEKIVAKKAQLEALGYDCSMLFVSVPIDIARARNAARARVVPDAVLVAAHAGAQESKSKYKALFGAQFVEYENAEELSDVEVRGKMVPELVRLTRRLIAGPVRNPIGREWVKSQLSASELATHPALSESADLRALAKEIRADWKSMPSGISSLVKEFEQQESSIWTIRAVRYFLAQSKGWQGDTANRIKSELRKFLSESVEEAEKPDDLDATYASWRKSVNMSASQLRAWSNSPCSRKASLSASAVIERNLELLETPKEKWDSRLVANAKRTISFIARMSKMEQGEPVSEECKISKRDISLKNWAYDPAKGRNESVEDGIGSNQYPMDLRVGMRVRFVTGGSGSYGSGTTGTIIGRNNENNLWIVRDDAGGVEEWERMDLHPEIQPQDYDARTDADLEMASESEISEWGVAAQRGRVRAMQQARDRVRFAGSRSDDDEDEEEPKGRKSDKKDSDEEEVEERTVSANVGGFDPDLLGAGEEDEDYEDEDEEEDDISPEAEFGEAHWSSGLKSDGLPRFATQDGEDEEDSEAEVVIEAAANTVKVWPKDQEDHRKIMAEYSKALMDRKNAVSLNASRRMRKLETVPVPELPSKPVFPFAFDGSRYIGMLDADFENLSPDEIAKQLKRAGAEVEGKISVRWLHHANEALDEVSPPGFKGTVKAMKRAQARGDIPADSNVFALAWAMKKRGAKPHYSSKAPFKKKAESEEPVSNTVFEWKNDGSGDCMEVAARYVLENHAQNPNLILVHALVYGRGPIEGRRFTHAWVLDGNTVIDKSNGLNVRMDRTAYERMGGVNTDEEGAYMEYDHRSLVTNLKLSKHWGPWDLDPDLEEGIPTSVRQIGKLRKRLSADDLSLLDGAAATEAVRVEDSKLHEFAKVAKELGVPLTTELEQEDDGSWTIYLDSRVAAKIRAKLV